MIPQLVKGVFVHGLVTRLMHEGRPDLVCLAPFLLLDVCLHVFLSQLVPPKRLTASSVDGGALLSELVFPIRLVDFCRLTSFTFHKSMYLNWPAFGTSAEGW